MKPGPVERRSSQRIVTHQLGQNRFWLSWYAGRVLLENLSIGGFSMSLSTPPASHRPFEFLVERDGILGGVSGLAQVVNYNSHVNGGLAGCRFVSLSDEASDRLTDWLAGHVLDVAAVPVSDVEAEDIVLGPSIV
ncbi:MAG: PilZ domain-containing protein [Rhodocyclaceae bacterium]|nr:PilZ domain-containing protein [Rhodocyclaceae bacterium]